jgi:NADH-quinone oxidoreductase subunit N
MNWREALITMAPEHLLLAGIVVILLMEIASRRSADGFGVAVVAVTAACACAAMLALAQVSAAPFPGQFAVAPLDLAAKAVVLGLAVPVLLLSRDEFAETRFHALVLSSLYGVCLVLSAESFLTLFVGLELMSLPVYVLVVLAYREPRSAEAALKYLVLGGVASACLLMGAALVYGGNGSLSYRAFAAASASADPMTLAGVALVTVAFFLKAAVGPFHAWAPDAYEGATVPVTAYMATIVKAAVLLAAVGGVILGALYMLWFTQRFLFGAVKTPHGVPLDLSARESTILVAIVAAIFWLGLFPAEPLAKTELAAKQYQSLVMTARLPASTRTASQ